MASYMVRFFRKVFQPIFYKPIGEVTPVRIWQNRFQSMVPRYAKFR